MSGYNDFSAHPLTMETYSRSALYSPQSSMRGSRPILVVEDDRDGVVILQHAFKQAGVSNSLRPMENASMAMAYLAGQPPFEDRIANPLPAVLLLDLGLPGGSGLRVLKWVRSHPKLHSMVVVILTGSANPQDICNAYSAGANSYLLKPRSLPLLVKLLQSFSDYWLVQNQQPLDVAAE